MDAPARRESLRALLAREPEAAELDRAATLYDRFLEDLPGLPIGTIHAWCQRLLGRFAADLGLDPAFEVTEKPDQLWEEALDRLEATVASDPAQRAELANLAASPPEVRRALTGLFADRLALDRWLGRLADARNTSAFDVERSAFHAAMVGDLERTLFQGTPLEGRTDPRPADLVPALIAAAERFAQAARGPLVTLAPKAVTPPAREQLDGFANAPTHVHAFAAAADDGARAAATAALRRLLLTQGGKLRALKGGKAGREERDAAYLAAARPLLEALALIDLLALCRRNDRLFRFGLGALDIYERLKKRDRVIDFHDLERLARHLVTRSAQKEWIQYRLDAATEHLLVDEFQDTNQNQWDVLRPIAEEFLAGQGAHDTTPTVFVVGDVKQSIYRFRGAEPGLFALVAQRMATTGGESGVRVESLPTNFRSVPAVVESVGRLFTAPPLVNLLPDDEAAHVRQYPSRATGPLDEVLVIPPYEDAGADDGADAGPVDRAAQAAVRIVLRLRAGAVVADKETGQPRPMTWGDILVLCRSRTHIGAYEEALRPGWRADRPLGSGLAGAQSRGAGPVAAAALAGVPRRRPRSRVGPALAALPHLRDPAAAGARAAPQPERRAPLPPLALDRSAHARRPGRTGDGSGHAHRMAQARGVEGCHDLLRRIYRDADAPDRFAAALGEQARWNLLRLHDLALALDLGPHPSLRRFGDLVARAAETSGEEEATVPEQGAGRVRVMTVHAAKGLEAPAVLFVDSARPLGRGEARIALAPGDSAGPILYGLTKSLRDGPELSTGAPPIRPGALDQALTAAGKAARNEDADILYVAMTRARDRLYVLGSRGVRDGERPNHLAWLQQAAAAATAETGPLPAAFGRPDWLDDAPPAPGNTPGPDVAAPAIQVWTPPPLTARVELLNPSAFTAPGADTAPDGGRTIRPDTLLDALLDAPGEDGVAPDVAAAAARGTAIHLWLRMATEPGGLPANDPAASRAGPLVEARAVAANPAFAWIFRPEGAGGRGWSEAGVIHERPPTVAGAARQRVLGAIDRLVRRGNRVDIIDYKSNRLEGDAARIAAEIGRLAAHYAPQLAAYRAAVAELFPGHEIATSLLFTHARDAAGHQGVLAPVTPASSA